MRVQAIKDEILCQDDISKDVQETGSGAFGTLYLLGADKWRPSQIDHVYPALISLRAGRSRRDCTA